MYCNRPYEIFAMSSPQFVSKRKYSVTLDFDVYEDFNPYEINWNKLFQIEGQEHLDVNIKNLDVESDINWWHNIQYRQALYIVNVVVINCNKIRNIFVSASIIKDRDIFAMYILYKIPNIFISTYFLIWVAFRL